MNLTFLIFSLSFFSFDAPVSCAHIKKKEVERKVRIRSSETQAAHLNKIAGQKRIFEENQNDSSDDNSSENESDSDSDYDYDYDYDYESDSDSEYEYEYGSKYEDGDESDRHDQKKSSSYESMKLVLSNFATMGLSYTDPVERDRAAIDFVIGQNNEIFNTTFSEVQEMRAVAFKTFAGMSVESVGPEVYFLWEKSFSRLGRLRDYLIVSAKNYKLLLERKQDPLRNSDDIVIESEFDDLIRLIDVEKLTLSDILEPNQSKGSISTADTKASATDSDASKTALEDGMAVKVMDADKSSGETVITDNFDTDMGFLESRRTFIKEFCPGIDSDNVQSEEYVPGSISSAIDSKFSSVPMPGGGMFATTVYDDEPLESEGYMTGGRTSASATQQVSIANYSEGYLAGIMADPDTAMNLFSMHTDIIRAIRAVGVYPDFYIAYSEGVLAGLNSNLSNSLVVVQSGTGDVADEELSSLKKRRY